MGERRPFTAVLARSPSYFHRNWLTYIIAGA